MKIKVISLLALCIPLLLKSQVTINVVQPPAGMIRKDQLWNLILTNNGNPVSEVTILMNLKDAVTGQTVLSAGTRSMFMGKGVKMLAIQDIQPVQYNYGSSALAGNFLPPGSYIACYTVNRFGHELMESIATECARINISPLSPPLLNTPANKTTLATPAPQLTWIPPTPAEMFDNLTYDVSVAEVMDGQSPAEAIMYNTPVYSSSWLKAPYQNYPSSYSKLQAGKTYAWRVTARNNGSYAAATEVWSFSLATDSSKKEEVAGSYISIGNSNRESGVHLISGDQLRIKYYSFEKTHVSVIKFLNNSKKVIQEVKQSMIYGDNYLSFSLNHLYHKGKIYFIEIADQHNNTYTAAFSIK